MKEGKKDEERIDECEMKIIKLLKSERKELVFYC
jgi:hypothetical protein